MTQQGGHESLTNSVIPNGRRSLNLTAGGSALSSLIGPASSTNCDTHSAGIKISEYVPMHCFPHLDPSSDKEEDGKFDNLATGDLKGPNHIQMALLRQHM
jgi:hypothetical protein